MNVDDATSPDETVPAHPISGARRLLRSRWITGAVLVSGVMGLAAACATPSATATSPSATAVAAGDPTLGLDRPQGERPARSTAWPPRASPCRHQLVRR